MTNSKALHPVHACNDGVFNSASGEIISLRRPKPEMIQVLDILAGLSKICRFGGQIDGFYSVAQHSVLVAALVPDEFKRHALLHDAAEAYLGDVIKPLKVMLGDTYSALEDKFDRAIADRFGIDWSGLAYPTIKAADMKVLEWEHEALQNGQPAQLMNALDTHGLLLPDQWLWDHKTAHKLLSVSFLDHSII